MMVGLFKNRFWFIFGLALLVEWLLFRHYIVTHIAPFYPANFDQTDYLKDCYSICHALITHGDVSKLSQINSGILFQYFTIGLFFIFGASRLVALSLGFIFFAFMQWTLVLAARQHFKENIFVYLLWGSVLSSHAAYMVTGGMYDFRMDFSAMCLYGILVNLFVLSEQFKRTPINYFTALVILILLGTRFISATYVLLFFCMYFFVLVIFFRKELNKSYVKNLLWLATFVVGVALVYAAFFFKELYDYYVVGHVLSQEKTVRLAETGVKSLASSLFFYFKSFARVELNNPATNHFYILLLLMLIPLFIENNGKKLLRGIKKNIALVGFFCFIVAPYIVLTADEVKSPVVANVMLIPFWWLCIELLFLTRLLTMPSSFIKIRQWLLIILVAFSFVESGKAFMPKLSKQDIADNQQVSEMYMAIGDQARSLHKDQIYISFNQIAGYLASHSIEDYYYEQRHELINIEVTKLGGQIFAITKDEAINALHGSDFVVFTQGCVLQSPYPFAASIELIRPELDKILAKDFVVIGHYKVGECTLLSYMRKEK